MDGINVRLSDGADWKLTVGDNVRTDQEFEALLTAAMEVEDLNEALHAELAVTIYLLRRNYKLSADQLALLLTFAPDDPALPALQKAIHEFLVALTAHKRVANPNLAKENPIPRPSDIIPGSI